MRTLPLSIPQEGVADFCRRHHIRRLALFGSVLSDRFGPGSDSDVLVEFEPQHTPGFLGLSGMELELTDLLGRKKWIFAPHRI